MIEQHTTPPTGQANPKPRPVRFRNLIAITVVTLTLGLLIWAKLQLVVGVPRTAIATPDKPLQTTTAPSKP